MRTTKLLTFCAEGPFALFTCPSFKTEKVSYDCMTPTAARGLVHAILWKPAVDVVIERIIVCNPVRRGTMTVNGVSHKVHAPKRAHFEGTASPSELIQDAMADRLQSRQTMLIDVRYVVEFRYVMTDLAGPEETPVKFEEMFRKRIERGASFKLAHFGLQQHIADCRPVTEADVPIDDTKDLGMMPHYRIYGDDEVETRWFPAQLIHGVLEVPPRDAPPNADPFPRTKPASRGAGDRASRFSGRPTLADDIDAGFEELRRQQQLEREELERMQARERAKLAMARAARKSEGPRR